MVRVGVQLKPTVLMECAPNVQEIQHTVLKLEYVDVLQDIEIKEDTVLLDVDPIRSCPMDSAAASLATIQSMESAANATGIKSMTKALESAESHATPRESTTSKPANVNAYPNSSNWRMEHAKPAPSTRLSTQ